MVVPNTSAICSSARSVCSLAACVATPLAKYLSILTMPGLSSAHRRRLERPSPKSSSARPMPAACTASAARSSGPKSRTCSCSVSSSTTEDGVMPCERRTDTHSSALSCENASTNARAPRLTKSLPGCRCAAQRRTAAFTHAISSSISTPCRRAAAKSASGLSHGVPRGPRTSASWPWMRPSRSSTMGWKCVSSAPVAISDRMLGSPCTAARVRGIIAGSLGADAGS